MLWKSELVWGANGEDGERMQTSVISGEKEEPSEEGFEASHVELDLVRQGDCKKTLVM